LTQEGEEPTPEEQTLVELVKRRLRESNIEEDSRETRCILQIVRPSEKLWAVIQDPHLASEDTFLEGLRAMHAGEEMHSEQGDETHPLHGCERYYVRRQPVPVEVAVEVINEMENEVHPSFLGLPCEMSETTQTTSLSLPSDNVCLPGNWSPTPHVWVHPEHALPQP
jgi:hypothetical protein